MKLRHSLCLVFLYLLAISCENTILQENAPAITKTTSDYYGSNFQEVQFGANEAFGYLRFNPIGAEYSFSLATVVNQTDAQSIVSIIGGNIIYKGKDVGNQIYGVSGAIRFSVKFTSTMAKVTLTLKGTDIESNRVSARLVIDERKYNGETLPLPMGDALNTDLIVGRLP